MKWLIVEILKIIREYFLILFFPNKCVGCGVIIGEDDFLCPYCHNHIERLDCEKICLICGYEKEDCICSSRVFHFKNIVSVFQNMGIAKNAYYSYKFLHRMHYGTYFAQQMSLAVKTLYSDVNFDYLCSVPTAKKSIKKYGFDHCSYLAKKMSKILEIPYLDNLLVCNARKTSQHNSSFAERLKNVKGKYSYTHQVKGRVLLIDDIRTTGATLDECAKEILFAGADEVYCLTALTTMLKKKIEK